MSAVPNPVLLRCARAESMIETSPLTLGKLDQTETVELFLKQLALLKKRLRAGA